MNKTTKLKIKNINISELEYFRNFASEHIFNTGTELIYNGQIPMAAYILIEGSIELTNSKKKVVHQCEPLQLIGFYEIYTETAFNFTAFIKSNTKVLTIDRSAIREMKQHMSNKKISYNFSIDELMA
jgi:CRP-like cAMP-binding protein